jgi:hypothetical protein
LCQGVPNPDPSATAASARSRHADPAAPAFFSQQTSHQQPGSNTFLSEQISTSHQISHQPNEQDARRCSSGDGGGWIPSAGSTTTCLSKVLIRLRSRHHHFFVHLQFLELARNVTPS